MNDRQRRFVEAYVRLGVAGKAYADVYPEATPATCETNGPRLLRNAQIRAAVDARQANLANELGLTPQYVLEQLEEIRRLAMEGWPRLDKDGNVIGTERQLSVAAKSVELLGKRHAMWVDRQQVETSGLVEYTLSLGGSLGGDEDDVDDGAEQ